MLNNYTCTKKMKNKSINPAQRKTTLKWNMDGELSSIDMARIINALSETELKECELTCNRVSKNERTLKLGRCLEQRSYC